MLSLIQKLFGKGEEHRMSPFGEVSCDEVAIKYSRPEHEDTIMPWDRLVQISIITTDLGPFQEDVFFAFLLSDNQAEETIPQGAKGTHALLSLISKLDGYDDKKVIEAMGLTENARFVCWRR